jgi:hypothetical protein
MHKLAKKANPACIAVEKAFVRSRQLEALRCTAECIPSSGHGAACLKHPFRDSMFGGAGKLFALGLLIHGGVSSEGHFPVWDLSRLRTYGVLQRIALCFLLASLLVLYVPESRLPKIEVGVLSLL